MAPKKTVQVRLTPEQSASYALAERDFKGFMQARARRWSAKGAGDFDDLFQDARQQAMRLWQLYDPTRGPFTTMLGVELDNLYKNRLAAVYANIRMPYIWESDTETGEWRQVACRPSSIDAPLGEDGSDSYHDKIASDSLPPDQQLEMIESERDAQALLTRLKATLTKRQRLVLNCMVNPDWSFHAMVRNLTGGYLYNKRHIAMFVDASYEEVEADANTVRKNLRRLVDA